MKSARKRTLATKSVPALPSEGTLVVPADAADAIRRLVLGGRSEKTRRAAEIAVRYWDTWSQARLDRPLHLPIGPGDVLTFIADHLPAIDDEDVVQDPVMPASVVKALQTAGFKPVNQKLATIQLRLSLISRLHTVRGEKSPMADAVVMLAMRGARKAAHRAGLTPKAKRAIEAVDLALVVDTFSDTPKGLLERAFVYFGWATGGRRRSEIAAARLEHLTRHTNNQGAFYLYQMHESKTRRAGEDQAPYFRVAGVACEAMDAWLGWLDQQGEKVETGPVFRAVRERKDGHWWVSKRPINPETIARAVKAGATNSGLGESSAFGGHSLRSGFVTEAVRHLPASEVMKASDHRDMRSVLRYSQRHDAETNPAFDLVGISKKPGKD